MRSKRMSACTVQSLDARDARFDYAEAAFERFESWIDVGEALIHAFKARRDGAVQVNDCRHDFGAGGLIAHLPGAYGTDIAAVFPREDRYGIDFRPVSIQPCDLRDLSSGPNRVRGLIETGNF